MPYANLCQRRLKMKMTQSELGKLCGVSMQTVCDWEKGRHKPSFDTLMILCDLLKIPHEELKWLFKLNP